MPDPKPSFSRRRFLEGTALGATALSLSPRRASAQAKPTVTYWNGAQIYINGGADTSRQTLSGTSDWTRLTVHSVAPPGADCESPSAGRHSPGPAQSPASDLPSRC